MDLPITLKQQRITAWRKHISFSFLLVIMLGQNLDERKHHWTHSTRIPQICELADFKSSFLISFPFLPFLCVVSPIVF